MSTETDPKKIVTYTQNECRAKAAAKLVEAQTYLNDDCPKSTELALAAAQFWATIALSAPKYDAPAPPESTHAAPLSESRQIIPPGVLTDLVHAPGRVIHYCDFSVLVTTADDGSVKFSAPVHWFPATTPPPAKCIAHGKVLCPSCSRSTGQLNSDGTCPECESFQTTGMHWDTCPHRDRSPLPAGERWRAGTGGGIPDYPRGGAEQWREG